MKRKSFGLALILWCSGFVLGAVLPSKIAAQTVRMMPLGNSITDGDGSSHLGGYRFYLYNALKDADVQFDFVGALKGGTGFPDTDHEGHGGFRADQLAVQSYLNAKPAEVVFLEIGTNDVTAGESATQIRNDIESIVDEIHGVDADIEIYLGTLIPRQDSAARQAIADELNTLLPDLVNDKTGAGYKIYLVDLASSFLADPNWQNNLLSDDKHPNDAGYQVIAQEWFNAYAINAGINLSQFSDNFNNGGLSASWVANPAFQVQSGQLVNTSAVDAWNNFIAVPGAIYNANTVEFKYGPLSDATGRAFTGAGVMLDEASTTANGYLIFHNTEAGNINRVKLWSMINGVPAMQLAYQDVAAAPKVGDTFRVDWSTDSNGHHFCAYNNGNLLACLDDPAKLQGNANKLYAGIMINGNTNNGVDDFYTARVSDSTPPAAVNDLQVTFTSALGAGLQWTAPGDDGNNGQARSYQLRYSTSPISESDFNQATLVTDVPPPGSAGSPQAFTVSGLESGETYYFALKTSDERSNLSEISNVASGTTKTLEVYADNFNRSGPELGSTWGAEPELQIVGGVVQNMATADVWSAAIYKQIKNPVTVSLRWGSNATTYGTNWCGILVMVNQTNPVQVSGYMIQRYAEGGQTRLWLVSGGQLTNIIDQGNSLAPDPKAGSEMKVVIHSDDNGHHFDVYVDDIIDRLLTDTQKLAGNTASRYAGFFLESTLGAANAIDHFTLGVLPSAPKLLLKVSGDGQTNPAGQLLPQPLVVGLVDSSDNPMPDQLINFAVTSGSATLNNASVTDDNIRLEAERADITSPIETRNDSEASGGKYIVYPTGHNEDASALLTFRINQAGNYRIWTRSQKPGGQPGSWTVSVDGGADFIYDVFQGTTENSWAWDLISARGNGSPQNPQTDPKIFNLAVGTHTIEFKARWEDTRLDKILLTRDGNFVPDGKEEVGYLTDANGLASAKVTLGGQIGKVEIQASYGNLAPVTFAATATVAPADSLVFVSGSGQAGAAGKTLAQSFKAKVTDRFGNRVANMPVSWTVTAGNGKLNDYVSSSDTSGVAETTFAPGNRSASNKVAARAAFANNEVVYTATTSSGIADAVPQSGISGNGQSGAVASALASPLIFKVTDASGKGVANYPVEVNVTRGGSVSAGNPVRNGGFEISNGGTPSNWSLEGNPNASEVLLSNDAPVGSKSLQVNSTRNGIGISQNLSYDANAGYTLSFWAKVRRGNLRVLWRLNDASGYQIEEDIVVTRAASDSAWHRYLVPAQNGVAGTRTILIRTSGPGDFFVDDVKVLRNTGNDGLLSMLWTLGDTAGVQQVTVNDGALIDNRGALKGLPLTFTANAKAGAPKQLALQSGDGQIGSAGQPLPGPFVVKVTDNFGNGVEKINVTFNVTAGNGQFGNGSSTLVAPSDSTGLAKAFLTLGATAGATNTVGATVQGLPGAVTFNAIAAIPSQMEKVASATQGSAGHLLATPLRVRVTDNSGNRISGFPVVFSLQAGGGNIAGQNSATIRTDIDGEAKATLVLGPNPGAQNRIVATAVYNGQPLQGSGLNFTVTAAKLKELSLVSGDKQLGIAGEALPKPLRAKIQDELGKGIKGQNVTFTVIKGGGKLGGNVNTKTASTDSLGVAAIWWTLGPAIGQNNNQVRAETNPALNGSPLTFTASAKAGPPSVLKEISGDSLSGVAGNPLPQPLVVQVTDKAGNGIAGVSVSFIVKSGGGNLNGVAKDTLATDQNGQAQITLTLGSTAGRYNNVVEARAFNGSLELTNSPLTFRASATVSNARTIALHSGNGQSGRAGVALANPFVVKIVDRNGSPVGTHPVRFRVVRGGGVFGNGKADTTVSTDAVGLAKAVLTLGGLVRPDSQIVFAASNDGVENLINSPIGFVAYATAGLPNATASYVEATSPVPADGVSKCNVKIYVRDAFDNPIANEQVTIQVSGETLTFPAVRTNAQGSAAFSFVSTRAGRKTISLKINGATMGRSATALFAPLAAEAINVVNGQSQTGNIKTVLPKLLSVQVVDKFNNGVPGHAVDFAVEAGGGRLLQPSPVLTDSNGVASVGYVLGANTGENRISASSTGLENSPIEFNATAVNARAANLVYLGGNNQQAIAGQVLPLPLSIKVTDRNNRAVFGIEVNFTVNFGGGTVNGNSSTAVRTDEAGEARVVWQLGASAGVNTVSAEANGLSGSPLDFQATAASDAAKKLVAFSGDGASGQINQEMPAPLTVRATDNNGNGVDGVHVFFELIQGTGALTGGEGTPATRDVMTANGGFASTKITFGPEIGARKIRITALNIAPILYTVFGRAGALKTIEAVTRTNHQRGTANKPLNFPLQVMAYDEQRNPVEGVQINFAVTQNSGYFSGGALNTFVLTNSQGLAEVEWTIKGGANKAQASAAGLQSPPLTFEATGVTDNNFPIITDVPDLQKREGDRIEFVIRAVDGDNQPIRYGAKNLPLGAVFDSLGTRIFTWQTDLSSATRYEMSFFAYDSRDGVDEEVVVIDVQNRNQAPVISSRFPVGNRPGSPDTTLAQPGTFLRMSVAASDPDGDALSYRWFVNGKFAGSVFDTLDFRGELAWNTVEALVFDLEDTARTVWSIKVPVELASFTAYVNDGSGVKLAWKTGSEVNNVGFNILRSPASRENYAKLNDKLIPSSREGSYTFIDAKAEAGGRYYYKLEALDTRGNITLHGPIMVDVAAPKTFELSQNYPNPFNPSTSINYQLPQPAPVRLVIYNMLGQEVRQLVNGQQLAGYHTAIWDGRDNAGRLVPSGIYHYRLQAGSFTMTKKMLMAK